MALKQFKTEWRLWFWISLTLFVIPWFVPTMVGKFKMAPILLFTKSDWFGGAGPVLMQFLFFSLLHGVPAVLIGWVLQSIIVVVRERRRKKKHDST